MCRAESKVVLTGHKSTKGQEFEFEILVMKVEEAEAEDTLRIFWTKNALQMVHSDAS